MKLLHELQTMSVSYQEICAGEGPWIALGNFMNDFFGNFTEQRSELVQDPIQLPANATPEQWRWAVFCAASVEYLCQQYALACPSWALNPAYTLDEPWYYAPGAHKESVRERLRQRTPAEFTRRNIYCGNRMFANKYELAAQHRA
ncbi:hypothetical protein KSC_011880 [Ktedonobacter sp. SOSP1-52]|uniref:hypothetical protein n=1 Tax=Ktedonobacter sp. SOSP1-52 TaxID=2778366 RepID=UPI0019168073|nr:hypothetical protein [Ktedonobacter sp. SOSP1-52]GHO62296.1 hypothetical protein KSC_011880 [Ktedonobacter sp. SOSP1-52]